MNRQAAEALSLIKLSMPQAKDLNPDAYLKALEVAAEDCSDEAIVEASKNCIQGKAPEVTNGFAPSPDKFGEYVRSIHKRKIAVDERKKRLSLPVPKDHFFKRANPFEKVRQACIAEGRELLVADIERLTFERECKELKYPVGSQWISTGEVWGPKNV